MVFKILCELEEIFFTYFLFEFKILEKISANLRISVKFCPAKIFGF